MTEEIKNYEISNRLFKLLAVLIAGVLVFLGVKGYIAFQTLPDITPREITVSATGRAFVAPDVALIKLGVTTEGIKVPEVVKENTEKMNAILKEVKNLRIEEKDIQTANYSLTPRYEWLKEGQRIFKGYTLNQEIRVKVRNFEKIGDVLEKGTEKGANLVGDLQFNIDDLEKVKEIARKDAIEKAKAQANLIASQAGLKLGKVVNVFEDYYYPYYSVPMSGAKMEGLGAGEISAAPEIQPGEQEITLKINLVYRIK